MSVPFPPSPADLAASGTSAGPAALPPIDLLQAALAARDHAYAPYSRFRVGAALRLADGRIVGGANVENASYGLAQCAERVALTAAVAQGELPGSFLELLVVGDTPEPIAPCGACRQVIHELGGPGLRVWLAQLAGRHACTSAGALLPGAFQPGDLTGP